MISGGFEVLAVVATPENIKVRLLGAEKTVENKHPHYAMNCCNTDLCNNMNITDPSQATALNANLIFVDVVAKGTDPSSQHCSPNSASRTALFSLW